MPAIELYYDSQIVHEKCYNSSCYYRFSFKQEDPKKYAKKVFANTVNSIQLATDTDDLKARSHYLSIAINETVVAIIYDPENTEYTQQLTRLYSALNKTNNNKR